MPILQDGASLQRTDEVVNRQVSEALMAQPAVDQVCTAFAGLDLLTLRLPTPAIMFVTLKDWDAAPGGGFGRGVVGDACSARAPGSRTPRAGVRTAADLRAQHDGRVRGLVQSRSGGPMKDRSRRRSSSLVAAARSARSSPTSRHVVARDAAAAGRVDREQAKRSVSRSRSLRHAAEHASGRSMSTTSTKCGRVAACTCSPRRPSRARPRTSRRLCAFGRRRDGAADGAFTVR
jgi:hypothetical protein